MRHLAKVTAQKWQERPKRLLWIHWLYAGLKTGWVLCLSCLSRTPGKDFVSYCYVIQDRFRHQRNISLKIYDMGGTELDEVVVLCVFCISCLDSHLFISYWYEGTVDLFSYWLAITLYMLRLYTMFVTFYIFSLVYINFVISYLVYVLFAVQSLLFWF